MAKSYNANLITDRDKVRFLSHDNVAGKMVLEDSEIDWLVTESANVYMAAAFVAEGIAQRLLAAGGAPVKSKKVGSLEIEYDTSAGFSVEDFQDLAKTLRARGSAYIGPWAGGVSLSDNLPAADATAPVFTQGQFDNPSITDVTGARPAGTPDRWGNW